MNEMTSITLKCWTDAQISHNETRIYNWPESFALLQGENPKIILFAKVFFDFGGFYWIDSIPRMNTNNNQIRAHPLEIIEW